MSDLAVIMASSIISLYQFYHYYTPILKTKVALLSLVLRCLFLLLCVDVWVLCNLTIIEESGAGCFPNIFLAGIYYMFVLVHCAALFE